MAKRPPLPKPKRRPKSGVWQSAPGRWRDWTTGAFAPPPPTKPRRPLSPETRAKLSEAMRSRQRAENGQVLPVPVNERKSTRKSKQKGKPGRGVRWKKHPTLKPILAEKFPSGIHHYHFKFKFPEQEDELRDFLKWLDQERTIEVRDLKLWPIKYQAILSYDLENENGETVKQGFSDYTQLTGESIAQRLDFGKFLALKTQSARDLSTALKLDSNLHVTINVMSLIPLPW